jgi:homospermidine synthase
MALGVAEMLWLKRLLKNLKINHGAKMKLCCDSKSEISIANNLMQHDRTKHVEIDRFFIKEKLKNVLLELSRVATENLVVDCLTKGFSSIDLVRLCNKMGLMNIFCPS